jgi:hypothetical protein
MMLRASRCLVGFVTTTGGGVGEKGISLNWLRVEGAAVV